MEGPSRKETFARTELLLGEEVMAQLEKKRVAVFGLGGVGGYVCEALVRSGIGAFDLIDRDVLSASNLNRQILATRNDIGRPKVDVMEERMRSIVPEVDIRIYREFFLPETSDRFPFLEYDYVVDAVDTVTAKIELILRAREAGVPVISCMGTGNKIEPGWLRVADLSQTRICPLARVMRKELRKRGVESLKVVYSEEAPREGLQGEALQQTDEAEEGRRAIPGSLMMVPAAAGLLIAAEVIKDLTGQSGKTTKSTE